MMRLLKLQNAIQPYSWGSHTAIAELMGNPGPTDNPQAELWMGAHPKASSKVWIQGRWQSLVDLVRQDPVPFLGQAAVDRFGAQLPFLFKVLAVDQPLSIQAHPSKEMAVKGFARENAEGIALSAPHRNYRDDQHKPECVCALTLFQALCGFRDPKAIHELLDPVWPNGHRGDLDLLNEDIAGNTLQPFFVRLMTIDKKARADLLQEIVAAAQGMRGQDQSYEWMIALNGAYPEDVGILAPILLHLVELQPGQALFLPAGCLHAYLGGLAIEVMANSDNVLRGGLTTKHVDPEELVRILDFRCHPLQVLEPQAHSALELFYISQAEEFELSVVTPQTIEAYDSGNRPSAPEILLCIDGAANFQWEGSSKGLDIIKGESVFVPACVDRYEIHGQATFYRAGVNGRLFGYRGEAADA